MSVEFTRQCDAAYNTRVSNVSLLLLTAPQQARPAADGAPSSCGVLRCQAAGFLVHIGGYWSGSITFTALSLAGQELDSMTHVLGGGGYGMIFGSVNTPFATNFTLRLTLTNGDGQVIQERSRLVQVRTQPSTIWIQAAESTRWNGTYAFAGLATANPRSIGCFYSEANGVLLDKAPSSTTQSFFKNFGPSLTNPAVVAPTRAAFDLTTGCSTAAVTLPYTEIKPDGFWPYD